MKKTLFTLAVALLVVASSGTALAQEGSAASWVHVRVDEADGAKVNVNLPMALIEVALDIVQREAFAGMRGMQAMHGNMEMGEGEHGEHGEESEHEGMHETHMRMAMGHDVDLADLRTMWNELREAGEAEYVNVQDDDESVRVFREGDTVFIQVDDGDDEKVRVQVHFSVVDTLLEGEGNELNLVGALREMARSNNGEIIEIQDGDTTVRVWIDNNKS